jgi:histone H3/H4
MDHLVAAPETTTTTTTTTTTKKRKQRATRLPKKKAGAIKPLKVARPGAIVKPRKKPRFRTEISLGRQVKKAQKNAHLSFAFRRLPFQRIVREIAQNHTTTEDGLRFRKDAFSVLQFAFEEYGREWFEDLDAARAAGTLKTIRPAHAACVKQIYSRNNGR